MYMLGVQYINYMGSDTRDELYLNILYINEWIN